jgi:hypothetical protein
MDDVLYTVLSVAELLACESLQVFVGLGEGVENGGAEDTNPTIVAMKL